MQFDLQDEGWTPAHDRQTRLRSPWALAVALALLALGAAAASAAPSSDQRARPAVAGVLP
jgi:hypothetical protein